MTREARILLGIKLAADVPVARNEDTWDTILSQTLGLHPDQDGNLWVTEVNSAILDLHEKQDLAIQKRRSIAERMHEIVEKERALAEEEAQKIRGKKRDAIKTRRLIRKAEKSTSDLELGTNGGSPAQENTTYSKVGRSPLGPDMLTSNAAASEDTECPELEEPAI